MRFRFGTAVVLGLAFVLAGCASSSGGSDEVSAFLAGADGDEYPEWIDELAPGTEPRDNDHTTQGALALIQAATASDEDARVIRYREALQHAEAGMAADPENPHSYLHAGEAYLGLGQLREAGQMFDRAEEMYPRYILETIGHRENAWMENYNEGVEYFQAQELEEAAGYFERANMIYTYRPEAMLNLGNVYIQLGRYEEAAEQFGNVVDVIEGPWAERMDEELLEEWMGMLAPAKENHARLLLRVGRFDDAVAAFESLIENDPESLDYRTALATALVAGGRHEEAQALFEDLLTREGLDGADYYTIGVGFYQADEFAGAAQAFRRAWEIVPYHRDNLFNLAQTLLLAEEWEELAEISERLLELDPLNRLAYTYRANALLQTGESDAAMAIYETGEALPVTMDELRLEPVGADIALVGQLSNHEAAPNHELRLRFTFYDPMGSEIGTADTIVRFTDTGQAQAFQVNAPDGSLFGFRYQVLD